MDGPTLIDRREQPPGVLPRHLREWVLIGIAVVMIGILAMGGGSPKPHPTASSPTAEAVDPNQQRIEAYQARIQEQAKRLAQEQAELERAKRAVDPGAPATRPAEPTGSRPVGNGELPTAGPTPVATTSMGSTTQGLRQERAQRDYRSLFADNVAFSRERVRGDRSPVAQRQRARRRHRVFHRCRRSPGRRPLRPRRSPTVEGLRGPRRRRPRRPRRDHRTSPSVPGPIAVRHGPPAARRPAVPLQRRPIDSRKARSSKRSSPTAWTARSRVPSTAWSRRPCTRRITSTS
jgi:hypothetical protein